MGKHIGEGEWTRSFRANYLRRKHFTFLEAKILSRFRWISESLADELNEGVPKEKHIKPGPTPPLRKMAEEREKLWVKFWENTKGRGWSKFEARRSRKWVRTVRNFYVGNGWIAKSSTRYGPDHKRVLYIRKQISPLHWYEKWRNKVDWKIKSP